MKYTGKVVLLVLLIMMFANHNVWAQDKFKLVEFSSEDGGKVEGAYFNSGKTKIVIFAHGAIFNKESWYFLAEEFQGLGISALSIDFRGYGNSISGNTEKKLFDVLGAISYAKKQGFNEICVVGASMGGTAVLSALSYKQTSISKVILLAPAGGPPIKSSEIDKFFVVSKGERLYQRVKQIYTESQESKKMKEYLGNTHAQHMFKASYANELRMLIIDFIVL
jgi:alpha-beta hydrolase superfamily lysophospholipase